uniref:Very-long-chain (3R)-3-hydroxyacyl-CoA dehydratase n=1 Tax=Leptobrachium leishanense TaxID=445787 RepID=A0A8C5PWA9_9ANUR
MASPVSGGSKLADNGGHKKRRGPGALATAYLVIYNVVMTAGWLVIAVGLIRSFLAKGNREQLYYSIERPLKCFQTGALLEVLHCAAGIVPSSVVLTAFQVMSRVFLTWAVTHSVREVQDSDSVLLFVVAWTVTEIIRYLFYTFSLLNHLPYVIKWASLSAALLPHDSPEEESSRTGAREVGLTVSLSVHLGGVFFFFSLRDFFPVRVTSRAGGKAAGMRTCLTRHVSVQHAPEDRPGLCITPAGGPPRHLYDMCRAPPRLCITTHALYLVLNACDLCDLMSETSALPASACMTELH